MLVLSRKKDEAIIIKAGIKITVVEIRDNRVLLGLEAPKEVSIRRAEISDIPSPRHPPTLPPSHPWSDYEHFES